MKPRLLDLFCGAGGAAMGYARAGFEVVGVDINPQPHYPFEFIRGDALALSGPDYGHLESMYLRLGIDAIHASPPCQAFTRAGAAWTARIGHASERHPDLLGATRDLLRGSGLPYIIENVPGAPLRDPLTLCGLSFGLGVKRHRLFESNILLLGEPCPMNHDEDFVIVFGGGVRGRAHQQGRTHGGKGGPIIRRSSHSLERGRQAMGIDWMDRHELSQAIPPAYTEHLGRQLLQVIERSAA